MARKRSPVKPGDVFGQWTVLDYSHRDEKGRHFWNCQCSCGYKKPVYNFQLTSGRSTKCQGCARKISQELMISKRIRHGRSSETRGTYAAWVGMKSRCNRTTGAYYHRYRGRGIKFCDRWKEFSAFLSDMGEKPSPTHQLDRIDNDGDYTPENCRWATPTENSRNRSCNRYITAGGETRCVSEWAEITGICFTTLQGRLARGWDGDRIINTPVDMKISRSQKKIK